ncbi:MAG: GAF domain-containing sensor histidine kinase [Chloroflexi bacterium]|nr:GAF domain-containing sensor histidine kinase [Chloroflexota bacterium]
MSVFSSTVERVTGLVHTGLTSAKVMRWRWVALLIVLALVALHELFLSAIILQVAPVWRDAVGMLVYSLTGISATWFTMTMLARALARREQVEAELRAAFAELEFNHQKLLALNEFGKRITDANHEETVYELAAQGAVQLTGARASSVVTFDDNGDRLKLDVTWGLSDHYLHAFRARLDAGVSMLRCRDCSTLKTHASSDCPLFLGLHDEARAEGIGSLVCLPIVRDQERVGIISAYFPTVDGPPEDYIRLLNILGGVIASALDSLRQRQRQVGTLHALDRASQSAQALNDLAAQVLDIAAAGWDAHAGGIFLFDEASETWTCRARRNLGDALTDARFQLGLQLANQTHETRAPVLRANVASDAHDLLSVVAAPLVAENRTFGAMFLGSRHARTFTDDHVEMLTTMAHQIALAIRNAQLYAQVNQLAVLEERYRLSREIHDGLAQTLGYLSLQAERLENLIASQRYDATTRELSEMQQTIRGAYVDVREAIDGLRLGVDEPDKLVARLTDYVDEFARQTGIAATFTSEPAGLTVSPEMGMQLLRIAQEALTNVRKHSHARQVQVALRANAHEIALSVTDDGSGFRDAAQPGRVYHSHGMATMRERAQSLGGTLTVATGPGQGTRIVVMMPIRAARDSVV